MPVRSQEGLDALVSGRFHGRRIESLRPTITAELVAEHLRAPLGPHSDALQRVLNYLGMLPIDGKLITEFDGAHWFTCRLVGFPPVRATRLEGPLESEEQALHAVFRQRLADVFGLAFAVPG